MSANRSLNTSGRLVDVRCEEINIQAAGEASIVPAQGSGKSVVLLGYVINNPTAGDVNFHFQDSQSESLSGPFLLKTGADVTVWSESPILTSGDNRGLAVDTDGALAGHFKYGIFENI